MWSALKGVRQVTTLCMLWNKTNRAKNLKHSLTLFTHKKHWAHDSFIQEQQAVGMVKAVCKTVQTGTLQLVALFLSSHLSYFNKCLFAKKTKQQCTNCGLLVKTPTRGLNLYADCTCRHGGSHMHLGAWVNVCREHTHTNTHPPTRTHTHTANKEIDLVESSWQGGFHQH